MHAHALVYEIQGILKSTPLQQQQSAGSPLGGMLLQGKLQTSSQSVTMF